MVVERQAVGVVEQLADRQPLGLVLVGPVGLVLGGAVVVVVVVVDSSSTAASSSMSVMASAATPGMMAR